MLLCPLLLLSAVLPVTFSFAVRVQPRVRSESERFSQQDVVFYTTRRFAGVVSEVVAADNKDGTERDDGRRYRFMHMTKEQDQELKELGEGEAALMGKPHPLRAHKVKTTSSAAAGFGGSASPGNRNSKKKKTKRKNKESGKPADEDTVLEEHARAHAKVLRTEGIVRIDNVLTDELADVLKNYLVDLRARSTADVEAGLIQDSQERFADVLLNQNRCDLKIPLGPEPVNNALSHMLKRTCIRRLVECVYENYGQVGSEATLYELNCFMSNSGARRQLVHADNVCVPPTPGLLPEEPIMITIFVSLQDIDESMGPTTFIPGTHNLDSHVAFYETEKDTSPETSAIGESSKDRLLRTRKSVLGTLPKGACAVFDPRVLHCAGGNTCSDPDKTRALFYLSFKNPRVDHPGCPSCSGYGIADAELTIRELADGLEASQAGRPNLKLTALACYP